MIKKNLLIILAFAIMIATTGCCEHGDEKSNNATTAEKPYQMKKYAKVKLTADISHLSKKQKELLKLIFS